MTATGFAIVIAGAAFGLVGPLAAAHYERAPSDRLEPRLAAGLALACGLVLALIVVRYAIRPPRSLFGFAFGVGLGAIVGLAGVGIYGVLERLLLPALGRVP